MKESFDLSYFYAKRREPTELNLTLRKFANLAMGTYLGKSHPEHLFDTHKQIVLRCKKTSFLNGQKLFPDHSVLHSLYLIAEDGNARNSGDGLLDVCVFVSERMSE